MASTAPTSVAMDEQIQECLRMLHGKSDEHKFAGLLMITKLSDINAERLRDVRQQVVEIVGMAFFLRLLATKGDSSYSGLSSFQVLGLNLIASFCEDPTIARAFAQEKVARFALDQLALLVDPSAPTTRDCIAILQGLVQNDEGIDLLTQETLVGRIVSTLKKMMRSNTTEEKEKETPPASEETSIDHLVAGYWTVLQRLSTSSVFWSRLPGYDFEFLCTAFSLASGGVALQVLAVLNTLLQLIEDGTAPSELLSSRALCDLRVGVVGFLRTKWPSHERDECLRLVYQLMRHSGMAWTLPGTTLRCQETQDEVSGGKFVLFVLKLVGIEIKLMLDEVELALMQMEEPTIRSVEEKTRQHQEVTRAMAVLPVCYGIVEGVIAGIVSSVDGDMVLPYDILLQLKQSFTDTFMVVLEHLTEVRDFVKTHRYQDLVARQSPTVLQLDAVAFASVRVTSAWLAEDSDTCAKQIIDLMPFLVCYKPLLLHETTSNQTHRDPDLDDEDVDSDDDMDAVAEMLRSATRIHQDDAQIDQLHFLLPGLLQISAMPEGGQAMADDVDVLRRILRFCCTLCADISDGTEAFGGIPTLTLCLGILMNLLLLRSSNVQVTKSGRSATPLPNAIEWYRALSFLLPVACASGSHLMTETTLTQDERGDDDRYVMMLHVACVILLIASNFQDKKTRLTQLSPMVGKLVNSFNGVIEWLIAHPPEEASESANDLLELCRGLSLRSPLHEGLFN